MFQIYSVGCFIGTLHERKTFSFGALNRLPFAIVSVSSDHGEK
jgi:hypothetical protein